MLCNRAKDIIVRIAQRLHFPVLVQLSYPVLSVFSRHRREVHRHPPEFRNDTRIAAFGFVQATTVATFMS